MLDHKIALILSIITGIIVGTVSPTTTLLALPLLVVVVGYGYSRASYMRKMEEKGNIPKTLNLRELKKQFWLLNIATFALISNAVNTPDMLTALLLGITAIITIVGVIRITKLVKDVALEDDGNDFLRVTSHLVPG